MPDLKIKIRDLQIAAYRDPSLSENLTPFGHGYPWQLYTKILGLQLTAKLEQEFPAETLRTELDAIMAHYASNHQHGQYHAGGWKGVSLHAIDGNPAEDQDRPDATFAKTPALAHAPCMEAIMDSFPCEKRRVRILSLQPGHKVFWHQDFWHTIDYTHDFSQIRLHVPIITNAQIGFQISHEDCVWKPGELWYGDFTFPHRLQNPSNEARVHLVIDLLNSDATRALLPQSLLNQQPKRTSARKYCGTLMSAYNHVFATERRLAAKQPQR